MDQLPLKRAYFTRHMFLNPMKSHRNFIQELPSSFDTSPLLIYGQ